LQGSFLEKHFAAAIEDQHVHGAMAQTQPVDFLARLLADDFIALIANVKDFLLHDSSR